MANVTVTIFTNICDNIKLTQLKYLLTVQMDVLTKSINKKKLEEKPTSKNDKN